MTFRDLQDALVEEIGSILSEMKTTTADGVERIGFNGYPQDLPEIYSDDESPEQFFPYYIVRIDSGKTADDEDCWHVAVDVVLGVHEDGPGGHRHILTAIQRIVNRFTETPRMGNFRADQQMEWATGEGDYSSYQFGAVSLTFSVPKIARRSAYV